MGGTEEEHHLVHKKHINTEGDFSVRVQKGSINRYHLIGWNMRRGPSGGFSFECGDIGAIHNSHVVGIIDGDRTVFKLSVGNHSKEGFMRRASNGTVYPLGSSNSLLLSLGEIF